MNADCPSLSHKVGAVQSLGILFSTEILRRNSTVLVLSLNDPMGPGNPGP